MDNIFDDILEPNTLEQAHQYAQRVRSGDIIANKYEQLAVERFYSDLKRDDLVFDEKKIAKALGFFDLLKLTKGVGAGNTFHLEGWQAFIVVNIFGFYWKESGYRRYKYAHIEIARKNGKSTFSAAIALIMFLIDGEAAPEVYCVATKREQAKIVDEEAKRMLRNSSALSKYVSITNYEIKCPLNDGTFKALASDSKTLDGLNIHCAIVDEIHEHKNRKLYDVLKSGTGSRNNSLLSTITTAGFNKESFAFRHRKTCIEILEGIKKDDAQFAIIFTLDEDDDWKDETVWRKANPNMDVSITYDYLKQECTQAINNSTERVNFLTKHLNLWTDAETTWIPYEVWNANPVRDEELLIGLDCYGGLDLAATSDITAFVLAFPLEDEVVQLLVHCWLPEDAINKNDNYRQWVDEGWLELTPGNVTDYNFIREKIFELGEKYTINSIAYDDWNSTQLITDIENEKPDVCRPMRQGFRSLSVPTRQLERLATQGNLIHNNNALFTWQIANTNLARDPAGNVKPKKDDRNKKIDAVAASVMAIAELLDASNLVYEDFDYDFI